MIMFEDADNNDAIPNCPPPCMTISEKELIRSICLSRGSSPPWRREGEGRF
jgi:hypothetical protein